MPPASPPVRDSGFSVRLAWLTRQPFAWRGSVAPDAPPNTLTALDRANRTGFGIVIDVQQTFDSDVVVFGDATLEGLTDIEGAPSAYGANVLQETRIKGTQHTIPVLMSALLQVGGRTPIIMNAITTSAKMRPLCYAIRRALEGYRGPCAVMSSEPEVVCWFGRNMPNIPRGINVTPETAEFNRGAIMPPGMRLVSAVMRSRPHFMAFQAHSLPNRLATRLRNHGIPILAMGVGSMQAHMRVNNHADNVAIDTLAMSGASTVASAAQEAQMPQRRAEPGLAR